MTAIAIVLFFFVFFILLVGFFFEHKARHKREIQALMKRFFSSSQAVVNDPRTSPVVVELIHNMSDRINDDASMRRFFGFMISGKAKRAMTEHRKEIEHIQSEIDEMAKDIRGHYYLALNTSMLIISFNSFFLGTLFRRILMFDIELAKKAREQEEAHRTEHLVAAYETSRVKGRGATCGAAAV